MRIRNVTTAFSILKDGGQKKFFPLGPQAFTDEEASDPMTLQYSDAPTDDVLNLDSEDSASLIAALKARVVELTVNHDLMAKEAETMRSELNDARSGNVKLISERDSAAASAIQAGRDREAAFGELGASRQEAEGLKAKVADLEAQLTAAQDQIAALTKPPEPAPEGGATDGTGDGTGGTEDTGTGSGSGSTDDTAAKDTASKTGRPKATGDVA